MIRSGAPLLSPTAKRYKRDKPAEEYREQCANRGNWFPRFLYKLLAWAPPELIDIIRGYIEYESGMVDGKLVFWMPGPSNLVSIVDAVHFSEFRVGTMGPNDWLMDLERKKSGRRSCTRMFSLHDDYIVRRDEYGEWKALVNQVSYGSNISGYFQMFPAGVRCFPVDWSAKSDDDEDDFVDPLVTRRWIEFNVVKGEEPQLGKPLRVWNCMQCEADDDDGEFENIEGVYSYIYREFELGRSEKGPVPHGMFIRRLQDGFNVGSDDSTKHRLSVIFRDHNLSVRQRCHHDGDSECVAIFRKEDGCLIVSDGGGEDDEEWFRYPIGDDLARERVLADASMKWGVPFYMEPILQLLERTSFKRVRKTAERLITPETLDLVATVPERMFSMRKLLGLFAWHPPAGQRRMDSYFSQKI